jgi:hypothetical protein
MDSDEEVNLVASFQRDRVGGGSVGRGCCDLRTSNICFFLQGGEIPVHSPKVDKDDEEPRHSEGCDRRWKQQAEIAGVRKRREDRNVWRQYDEEIRGRQSSYRNFATTLGSIVDPGAVATPK